MLGWLGWLGFWPGLFICFWRVRRTPYLFLLTTLLVLYLPALLSVPPAHALRLSALLPIYYIVFALGLTEIARWVSNRCFGRPESFARPVAIVLVAILVVEGVLTAYDYFYRWANAEETYVEYNTPLVEFVDELIDRTEEMPVVIPFQLYVHPTTRYLLHDHFVEQPVPERLDGPVQLVTLPNNYRILNVANIPELPSFVWLARQPDGKGVAYVSRPPRVAERAYLSQMETEIEAEVYQDRFAGNLAAVRQVDDISLITPMFTDAIPQRVVDLNWGNLAELRGYDVVPNVVQPDNPITINFYWRSLTDKTFEHRLFLQLIDSTGNPINQWEGESFREDMYRWRTENILPTQHSLWVGPDTPPGPYLVRMGFFDAVSNERLLLWVDGQPTNVDQIQLGLFYVSPDGADSRRPDTVLSANFADSVQLVGVSIPQIDVASNRLPESPASPLVITLYWQSLQPTDKPYTVFLQLLNEQGEVVGGWDQQPFGGLYPTSLWSPGEMVTDSIQLPLPEGGLPSGTYRLITGFYDIDTGQRLPLVEGGDFTQLAEFAVE
jgi:hypothetical protein